MMPFQNSSQKRIFRLCFLSICTTVAIVLSISESLLLPPLFLPGFKPGSANAVVLLILFLDGKKSSFLVSVLRCFVCALASGSAVSFLYSICGSLFSWLIMVFFQSVLKDDFIWVISIFGALAHNFGQILIAVFLIGDVAVFYYFFPLAAFSVLSGLFVGICSGFFIKKISKLLKKVEKSP